jgi:hypothetical protein
MPVAMRTFARWGPPAGVATVFVIAAWRALTLPVERLLAFVPDDTFYYLVIARNLVRVGVSTADGVSPTNGFHPVWMAICVIVARFTEGSGQLRAMLAISFTLHALTAVAIRIVLARLVDRRWATTAALCWLVNPLTFLIAYQALEATAYALALLLLLSVELSLGARLAEGRASFRQAAVYGACLGLVVLARTEGTVIVAAAAAWLAIRVLVRGRSGSAVRALAVAGVSAAAVVSPWLLFSWRQVGSLVQDSGAMKALWAPRLWRDPAGTYQNMVNTANFFVGVTFHEMTTSAAPRRVVALTALIVALVIVLASIVDRNRARASVLRMIVVSAAAVGLACGLMLTDRQVWWLVVPCFGTILGLVLAVSGVLDRLGVSPAAHASARTAFVLLSLVAFLRWQRAPAPYPWQPDVFTSQAAIEALVPAGEPIGCFNSGIPMFFGTRRVVALDGIVSHDARHAWTDHRIDEYWRSKGVRYIADEQNAMNRAEQFSSRPVAYRAIAAFPLRDWPSGQRLLWRLSVSPGD